MTRPQGRPFKNPFGRLVQVNITKAKCPFCDSTHTREQKKVPTKHGARPRYYCHTCMRTFYVSEDIPKPRSTIS